MEADQPHRRERLAGLLWPEQPERTARHSLSQALLKLRRAVGDQESVRTEDAGPPFLLVDRGTIQFNQASDHFVDVTAFKGLLEACDRPQHRQFEACDPCRERLEQAAVLYQGQWIEPDVGNRWNYTEEEEAEWLAKIKDVLSKASGDDIISVVDCHI